MSKIKSITLDFPNDPEGDCIYYCVGQIDEKTGLTVTKIMENGYCCGDQATHVFYSIFSNNKLIADMHQYGHIIYDVK